MQTDDQVSMLESIMTAKVDKTKMFANMEQSKAYVETRPRYTEELFQSIADYCKETNPNLDLAVDVGCGPGMSTIGFAKFFKKIIGVDVSETQIACAPKDIPNIEFKVGYSDKLPFIKSESVDLFCSGEAFNYMPRKETFAEADRVLKPGGTLAIFGYDMPTIDIPEVTAVIMDFGINKVLQFCPKETAEAFDRYRNLTLPYPGAIRNEDFKMTQTATVETYINFMRSTSTPRAYCNANPGEDVLGDFERDMKAALVKAGHGPEFTLTWNFYYIIAHKPRK